MTSFAQLFKLLLDALVLLHQLLMHLLRSVLIREFLATGKRTVRTARELPRRHLTGEWSAELSRPKLAGSRLTLPCRELVISISQRDGDLLLLIVAQNRELDLRLRFHLVDVGNQFGRIVDLLTVHLDDDVPLPQTGSRRGPIGSNISDFGSSSRVILLGLSRRPFPAGRFACLSRFALPERYRASRLLQENTEPTMRTLSRHRDDFDGRLPAVAINHQRHGAPRLSTQIRFQVSCLLELTSVSGNHAIIGLESGLAGRAVGFDAITRTPCWPTAAAPNLAPMASSFAVC